MRTLYLDCAMGAAGDMLTAALLELLPEREAFVRELNALGIPGVAVESETMEKCGILGTHVRVMVNGEEEDEVLHEHEHHDNEHGHHHHDHEHEHHHHDHDHDHEHGHHHSSLRDVEEIVRALPVSEKVRADVLAVYQLIAEAESKAHGVPAGEIHFHEVGTMDAIADVTAVCLLMERLAPEMVLASPVHVGCGQVRCAHGILPVPAPATARILEGVPIYGGAIKGELCTPTGAALLKHFVSRFGEMPVMRVEGIGYGMGKKDFPAANCVRAMIGEVEDERETIVKLECNIDDMTAEGIGFALEEAFAAGAVDAFTVPIGMKKSRPGTLIAALCHEEKKEAVVRALFRHTTTLGIRETRCLRHVLERHVETLDTPLGWVRRKIGTGYGVRREKYEYDDVAAIAREKGVSLEEALRALDGGKDEA